MLRERALTAPALHLICSVTWGWSLPFSGPPSSPLFEEEAGQVPLSPSSLSLGKLLNLLVPQFPHLHNEDGPVPGTMVRSKGTMARVLITARNSYYSYYFTILLLLLLFLLALKQICSEAPSGFQCGLLVA